MPDLYLGVLCGDCRKSHDLYNADPAPHARGCSYSYTCPTSGRAVALRISFPDATTNVIPAGAVPLRWVANAHRAA
jgi:hypothetical protein